MINYAHRGASDYAPENTLSAFYLGLLQGANGIETDVQMTKDGHLVLFHDDELSRVTDGEGTIAEHTLCELKALKVYGKNGFFDRIPTLREFLEKFSAYDISFALEVKVEGVEEGMLALAKEFGIMEKTTFTSFLFPCVAKIKELDKSARVGFLTRAVDDEPIEKLLSIGGEEFGPKAETATKELVARARAAGLGVRAWGVMDEELMKKMCALEVDGMTVNFPDKLTAYLAK
ncbi:MAG: hypothetical protein IKD11_00810 [Oscillospiraceae bacterium]|nr:hypothetical protein [Oscillospiraceae bacterium]